MKFVTFLRLLRSRESIAILLDILCAHFCALEEIIDRCESLKMFGLGVWIVMLEKKGLGGAMFRRR